LRHDLVKSDIVQVPGSCQTVDINMKQGKPARVFIYDRVRGARYIEFFRDVKSPGNPLNKTRLSASEITGQGNNRAREKPPA
jgi:hypothetical protein